MNPTILILGTRGVPAAHGGFETFAERLSIHLALRGFRVIVYCQEDVDTVTQRYTYDTWRGVERVHVQVFRKGAFGTIEFDWHSVMEARKRSGVCLVLGYNTAVLTPLLRSPARPVITNMDGLEWKRQKWSLPVRAWFFANEYIAVRTSDHLVADHPEIARRLKTLRAASKTTMIPYGADPVARADEKPVHAIGATPGRYVVSIARVEPENGILCAVRAWSTKKRDANLVVLGRLDPTNAFHRAVREAASSEVLFPGAIYDRDAVAAIRFHARAYFHGHRVGGTNPSLVEALAAGCPVLAHDNPFNRWTAGDEQFFFADEESCARAFDAISTDEEALARAGRRARARAAEAFRWDDVLMAYESYLVRSADRRPADYRVEEAAEATHA